jgi:hypothetical protein
LGEVEKIVNLGTGVGPNPCQSRRRKEKKYEKDEE